MFRLATTVLCTILCIFLTKAQSDNENDCDCVSFYLCKNGTINTDGEDIIDIRLGNNPCSNYLETCCKQADVVTTPTTTRAVQQTGCGNRNPDGIGFRITGFQDNEAQFGEFPWMVAILHKSADDNKFAYKCGGTLIHPQVVLTAAHCLINGGKFRVRAGEWDTKTTQEMLPFAEKAVTSAEIHSDFHRKKLHNDIALAFLESPFNISDYINVACLPPHNYVEVSNNCFVTGWGKDKFEKEGIYANILKRIQLGVVEREKCQNDFRTTRLGRFFLLHKSFMCAGGKKGVDACIGDGGGPLVCPIKDQEGKYQQIGIVAWGIGCGEEGIPGAYVDVASFRNWIDQRLKEKNYSLDKQTTN